MTVIQARRGERSAGLRSSSCSPTTGWLWGSQAPHRRRPRTAVPALLGGPAIMWPVQPQCFFLSFFFLFLVVDLVWSTELLNINSYVLFALRILNCLKSAESSKKQLNTSACSCCPHTNKRIYTTKKHRNQLSESGRFMSFPFTSEVGAWEWRQGIVSVPVSKSVNKMAASSCCC